MSILACRDLVNIVNRLGTGIGAQQTSKLPVDGGKYSLDTDWSSLMLNTYTRYLRCQTYPGTVGWVLRYLGSASHAVLCL